MDNESVIYYDGSSECNRLRLREISARQAGLYNEFLTSVVSFLNENGWVNDLQWGRAMRCSLMRVHDE